MLDFINVINANLKDVVLLLKNPPRSPFTKGGRCCVTLYKREVTQFPLFENEKDPAPPFEKGARGIYIL